MEGGRRQSVLERSWRSVCFQNLFYFNLGTIELFKFFACTCSLIRDILNFPAIARRVAVRLSVIGKF